MPLDESLVADLRAEIDALFPGGAAASALEPTLTELAHALAADERDTAWSTLDRLEDLLEAQMLAAGWPQRRGGDPR